MSSYSHSRYDPYPTYTQPTPDLQPLFSSLAVGAALLVLVAVSSSFYGLDWINAPFDSLSALVDMASLGISSLLGRGGLGQVDWAADGDEWSGEGLLKTGEKEGKGKMVRRYKDTGAGARRADGGGQFYPGLLNAAGNLCFLNATLQSMASLPSLLTYLDSLCATAIELAVSTPVAESLVDTLEALNTPSSSRPAPLRPVELASALAASSPSRRRLLASSDQQDAHELWGMIRDAVEEEAARVFAAEERRKLAGTGLAEVAKLRAGLGIALSRKKVGRGRNDPWFFLRSQRIKCMTCGYVRDTRHEGEELLMLQVPPVAHCSLYDLLGEYTKADLLSDYNCRRCAMLATLDKLKAQRDRVALTASDSPAARASPASPGNRFDLPPEPPASESKKMTSSRKERRRKLQKLVERVQEVVDAGDYEKELGGEVKMERAEGAAGKVVRFARSPDVLLLHLNRSSHYGYSGPIKNSCQVSFPEILDISPFCDGGSIPSSSADANGPPRDLYRLSSLVVHYGSHSFGHYVAFRRRPSSPARPDSSDAPSAPHDLPDWYRISDETVDPSSIHEALRSNPFLLFYERIRDAGASAPVSAGLAHLDAMANGAKARVVESWRLAGGSGDGASPQPEQTAPPPAALLPGVGSEM
ncbi:hypothetical protein JCM10207_004659 [Rhodosporidiobolus poonsookiae]